MSATANGQPNSRLIWKPTSTSFCLAKPMANRRSSCARNLRTSIERNGSRGRRRNSSKACSSHRGIQATMFRSMCGAGNGGCDAIAVDSQGAIPAEMERGVGLHNGRQEVFHRTDDGRLEGVRSDKAEMG